LQLDDSNVPRANVGLGILVLEITDIWKNFGTYEYTMILVKRNKAAALLVTDASHVLAEILLIHLN
jgi:hypothetical protein